MAAKDEPEALQIAALCRREGAQGEPEILLVTSRDTGRWLLPKGWPEAGRPAWRTALNEAWEEAGLTGARARKRPVGEYPGTKGLGGGRVRPCRVEVYPLSGGELAEDFPEKGQRQRRWIPLREAAELVTEEPGLRNFLRRLAGD